MVKVEDRSFSKNMTLLPRETREVQRVAGPRFKVAVYVCKDTQILKVYLSGKYCGDIGKGRMTRGDVEFWKKHFRKVRSGSYKDGFTDMKEKVNLAKEKAKINAMDMKERLIRERVKYDPRWKELNPHSVVISRS